MKGKLDILVAKTKPFYFVSYNSEDADRVSSACKILQSLDMPLWCDNDVTYGKQWERVIGEKIHDAEAVILFITKGILGKPESFVREEYRVAKFYEKPIYVVFLDTIEHSSIPYGFALWWSSLENLQNCYISHFNSLEEAMKDFAKGLGFAEKELLKETPSKKEPSPKTVHSTLQEPPRPARKSPKKDKQDEEWQEEWETVPLDEMMESVPTDDMWESEFMDFDDATSKALINGLESEISEGQLREGLVKRVYETNQATAGVILYLESSYAKKEDLHRFDAMDELQVISEVKPLLSDTVWFVEGSGREDHLLRYGMRKPRSPVPNDVLEFIYQRLFRKIHIDRDIRGCNADFYTGETVSLKLPEIDTKTPYRYIEFPFCSLKEDPSFCFYLRKRNDGARDDCIGLRLARLLPELVFYSNGDIRKEGLALFHYDFSSLGLPSRIKWHGRENDSKELIEKDEKDIETAFPYLLQAIHRFFLANDIPGGLKALFRKYKRL